jgi:succinyl-diaminopimelate desuccinylase
VGAVTELDGVEARVPAAVDELAEELIEFCRELIRIPTINPPGERYEECAHVIGQRLAQLGYGVEYVPAEGHAEHTAAHPRLNVIGRLEGAEPRPCVHFNGHFDVVPVGDGWTVDPFGGELRDGKIYGRGTCDQKAGIAASIYAVEAIRRAGVRLRGTVEQSATVDEESGGYAGVADLCDRGIFSPDRQDFVIITEPLNYDRVCIGHRGAYWFEVTTHGRIAHGSMPGYGVNAADQMAEFIHAVNVELGPRLAARTTSMPVVPEMARHSTINLNALHGGQELGGEGFLASCVADRCVAVYDRRFLHEEDLATVRGEIVALLEDVASRDPRFRYTLRDLWAVPAVATPRDARVVTTVEGVIHDLLGRPAAIVASPGTYDHKHVTRRAGIVECIAYGPGILDLAHQPDEYVQVEHLIAATKVMALATMRLVGVP